MLLDRNAGSIADWWFEGTRKSGSRINRFERNQLLKLCQLAIAFQQINSIQFNSFLHLFYTSTI